jgi:hypothetical protein
VPGFGGSRVGEEWASSIPGGGPGKASSEVWNGEQDQAWRAAFLIAADSNGDGKNGSQQLSATADNALPPGCNTAPVRHQGRL